MKMIHKIIYWLLLLMFAVSIIVSIVTTFKFAKLSMQSEGMTELGFGPMLKYIWKNMLGGKYFLVITPISMVIVMLGIFISKEKK